MPAILPLLTLLLVSHDEVAQLVVKSSEDSQYEMAWKNFTLARDSYFKAIYLSTTLSGKNLNGLKLFYTVNSENVYLKVNTDHTVITTLQEEDASVFYPEFGQSYDSTNGIKRFKLGYYGNSLDDRWQVHMEYKEGGTANVLLRTYSTENSASNSITCVSICQAK